MRFAGATLKDADFIGANPRVADLTDARPAGAQVEEADLRHGRLDPTAAGETVGAQRSAGDGAAAQSAAVSPEGPRAPSTEAQCREILGVGPAASLKEIAKAFKRKALQWHPDKVRHRGAKFQALAEEEFRRVQLAYDFLKHQRLKGPLNGRRRNGAENGSAGCSLEELRELAKVHPRNDRVFYNLGQKCFELDMFRDAIEAYERALALDPRNKFAQANLRLARLAQTLDPNKKK